MAGRDRERAHLISDDCAGPFGAVSPLDRPPRLSAELRMMATGVAIPHTPSLVGRSTTAVKPSHRPYLRAARQPQSAMTSMLSPSVADFLLDALQGRCSSSSTAGRPVHCDVADVLCSSAPVSSGIERAATAHGAERLQLADGVGGAAQQHRIGAGCHRQLRLPQRQTLHRCGGGTLRMQGALSMSPRNLFRWCIATCARTQCRVHVI